MLKNILLLFVLFLMKTVLGQVKPQTYFSDPALSPDATEVAFVSGGDIWTVSSQGGEARLLISNPGYDSRPLYSPDGKYLAFNSDRTGNGDIYIFSFQSGELKRLTYDDGNEDLSAWSPDSRYVYFSSSSRDIAGTRDVYRIKTEGGTAMPVTDERYTSEFFASPSPDGKTVAFNARGIASGQWWRNGSSHIDESEIWLVRDGKTASYERLTAGGAKELWPLWGKDGKTIYYSSDKGGHQNLWSFSLGGSAKQLTKFNDGRVLWPSIAANGQSIVFERDFKIWKYEIASGDAKPLNIIRRGTPAITAPEHLRLNNTFRELALSPDGKKIAFIAHGEVFVASSKEAGEATRITNTIARESRPVWAFNSNSIIYLSERDGATHIYEYNFITKTETRLTNENQDDAGPVFSPNGKTLAFLRNKQELRVLDIATKKETLLAKGFIGGLFVGAGNIGWSPDGKSIAYGAVGTKSFRNIYVVPATGGTEPKAVSFLANSFTGTVSWSPNGRYLLFVTAQRTERPRIARVDLVPQVPKFREDQFQQMFVQQPFSPSAPAVPVTTKPLVDTSKAARDTSLAKSAKSASESSAIIIDGIRQRLNLLPLEVDINDAVISKDGNTLLITADAAGQNNLYTYSLDENSAEPAVLKQITITPGNKTDAQFSPDGKEIFYLEQGRIQSVGVDSRQVKPLPVIAELDVDFNREKVEIFREAWDSQNEGYYSSDFNGVNWDNVRKTYEPLATGAGTSEELTRILNLMVGELNSSHSGVAGPPAGGGFVNGRLGLKFDRAEYENNGKFKITEITNLSAASLPGSIKVGDYLLAIDDKELSATDNIDQLLANKINKKVTLSISRFVSGAAVLKVAVKPVNLATEKGLLYKQWAQRQREYVAKISNGRLGYVHMIDMSQQSLDQLYLDIDAENHSREGVVIDVRNNNGGFVNAYALDVFSRKGYMTMTPRGLPATPARVQLGQRALEAPTVLVTNQQSLSDAEDFTEGYRAMGLGKVVGEPTAGWIIYTSAVQLIDGTNVRLPFIKITDHEGKNMEMAPRAVDIPVSRALGEGNTKDSQLDMAVKTLLEQIGKK